MDDLHSLAQALSGLGYHNLTLTGDHISGTVSGIDLSDASRSTPEGNDTGSFATLNNPESYVPEDNVNACDEANAHVTVLGSGGYSEDSYLHLYIKLTSSLGDS